MIFYIYEVNDSNSEEFIVREEPEVRDYDHLICAVRAYDKEAAIKIFRWQQEQPLKNYQVWKEANGIDVFMCPIETVEEMLKTVEKPHVLELEFRARSYNRAAQIYYDHMGYGVYTPVPDDETGKEETIT